MLLWKLSGVVALLVLGLVCKSGLEASAAEVECALQVTKTPSGEGSRRKWPSGFRPAVGSCYAAYLHGPIIQGDYEKIRTFYSANHRVLDSFSLNSPGGDALEAMKIGRLFRKYLISATAPFHTEMPEASEGSLLKSFSTMRTPDGSDFLCGSNTGECTCASACALIWFGAVDRSGSVGLHRPRVTDPLFKAMSAAEASLTYKTVLDELDRYLQEMEVPHTMIDTMVATGSAEIRWIRSDLDKVQEPPSLQEWGNTFCGADTEKESAIYNKLWAKAEGARLVQGEPLTENESMLKDLLEQKVNVRLNCLADLRSRHVDELPAP